MGLATTGPMWATEKGVSMKSERTARDERREDFGDLLENFNRAMMEVDPNSVQLDAPAEVQVAFDKYHAALRRVYA